MTGGPLIAILGPTAVGKTALAVALAQALDTDIVSGDSMLVYRGFDIGTAKPSAVERGGVAHALIDICDPSEPFSVSDFQRLATERIAAIQARRRIPVLAGGTGLYVKALLEGYVFSEAKEDTAYRREMEALAEEKGRAYVHDLLAAADPEAAARIPESNLRRVIRALEVCRGGRETISRAKAGGLVYDALVIGLRRERRSLYERIDKRVDAMMAAGLVDEVRGLLAAGVSRDAPAMKGIGYKEMAAHLAGETTLDEAVAAVKRATRRFAKRQFTWYRSMPYIRWLDVDGVPLSELREKVLREAAGFFPEMTN
ncbi:MAG: tRNA (adenosine(37)-N6)-dimethylallyltransferase MiaA [Schwartzia sp.]|nr:tRNA (adenosine(37)-N6)-dimethylallyltransferase MiaA [Schwartzia sp. (in: firmicutes)]